MPASIHYTRCRHISPVPPAGLFYAAEPVLVSTFSVSLLPQIDPFSGDWHVVPVKKQGVLRPQQAFYRYMARNYVKRNVMGQCRVPHVTVTPVQLSLANELVALD